MHLSNTAVEREGMVASFMTHFITMSISLGYLKPIIHIVDVAQWNIEHWWLKTKKPWVRFVATVFSYIVTSLTQTGPHDLVSSSLDSGLGMRLWKTA